MLAALCQGWLLGLATGIGCVASCAPVMVPYLVASRNERARQTARALGEYLLGRLSAYLLLGLLAGLAGAAFADSSAYHRLLGLLSLGLAAALLVNGLGRSFPEVAPCAAFCQSRANRRMPLVAGFVVGLSPCLPLMTALTAAASAGPLRAMVLVGAFFVASSLWLLPVVGVCLPARRESLRGAAEVALIVCGLGFGVQGLLWLVR